LSRHSTDRIVAISTAAGAAAIGVVRLSGPGSKDTLESLCRRSAGEPRRTRVRTLSGPDDGLPIDQAMVWWAPAPDTFTGDEMVELHAHGNPAVLDALVDACVRLGARPAEPGEFTRRALLAGKLDLSGAEAVLAAVDATSLAGARAAVRVLDGELARSVDEVRRALLGAAAALEASIDHEADVGDPIDAAMVDRIARASDQIEGLANGVRAAGRLVAGADVVILGPVNAGKSTLLNRLVGQERAIVHAEPGTTRDVVTGERELAGVRVRFHDTAGIRLGAGEVEGEGMRRAEALRARATCVLFVLDATRPDEGRPAPGDLVVVNKIDRDSSLPSLPGEAVAVSALTGEGIDGLEARLEAMVGGVDEVAGTLLWTQRQGAAAARAAIQLRGARAELARGEYGPAATEIGDALRSLDELLGIDPSEAVLDELFARFCVGK